MKQNCDKIEVMETNDWTDEEKRFAIEALNSYIVKLLEDVLDDMGDEGKQRPSKADSLIAAIMSDYADAAKTIIYIEMGWRLNRMRTIIMKEALNNYIIKLTEARLDKERNGETSNDARVKYITAITVVDGMLERVLEVLFNETVEYNIDMNGKKMVLQCTGDDFCLKDKA